jgi:hypothetical protein
LKFIAFLSSNSAFPIPFSDFASPELVEGRIPHSNFQSLCPLPQSFYLPHFNNQIRFFYFELSAFSFEL